LWVGDPHHTPTTPYIQEKIRERGTHLGYGKQRCWFDTLQALHLPGPSLTSSRLVLSILW
jgi:hypothetical protein